MPAITICNRTAVLLLTLLLGQLDHKFSLVEGYLSSEMFVQRRNAETGELEWAVINLEGVVFAHFS